MKNKLLVILNTIIFTITLLLINIRFIGVNSFNCDNEIQKDVINYINGYDNLSDKFNKTEIMHLKNVKDIINYIDILIIGLIIILIISSYYIIKKINLFNYEVMHLKTACYSLITFSIIFLIIYTNFYDFWNLFHKIIFNEGNWYFTKGIMIDNFPLKFFKDKVLKITIIYILLCIIDIYFYVKKVKKEIKYDISE